MKRFGGMDDDQTISAAYQGSNDSDDEMSDLLKERYMLEYLSQEVLAKGKEKEGEEEDDSDGSNVDYDLSYSDSHGPHSKDLLIQVILLIHSLHTAHSRLTATLSDILHAPPCK